MVQEAVLKRVNYLDGQLRRSCSGWRKTLLARRRV